MFTDNEVNLMRAIGLDCDFNALSEDDDYWAEIEDKVGEYLTLKCLDDDYEPDANGVICESILDKMPL